MKGKYVPGDYTLRVGRSTAGLGLYATTPIPKGACIIEYVGRQVSAEEEDTSKSKYLFEVRKGLTLDGKPKWNKAGYINHSCKPNAETEIHRSRIFILAIKNIKAGEEVTYDYGKEYWLEHCQPCRCPKHAVQGK